MQQGDPYYGGPKEPDIIVSTIQEWDPDIHNEFR